MVDGRVEVLILTIPKFVIGAEGQLWKGMLLAFGSAFSAATHGEALIGLPVSEILNREHLTTPGARIRHNTPQLPMTFSVGLEKRSERLTVVNATNIQPPVSLLPTF